MTADVVVAGAGVAGLACARALHDLGLRVLVLDRQRATPALAKGELLQPESVRILDEFGALPVLRETGAVPVGRLAIRDPGGDLRLNLDYAGLPGQYREIWCTPYADVLRALERSLPEHIEVRRGVIVDDLMRDGSGRVIGVRGRHAGTPVEITGRLVVAADGASSRLRRSAGLAARRQQYRHRLVAIELPTADVDAEVSAYLSDRGLRLVYPLPDGRARVYVQISPDEWRDVDLDSWLDGVLAEVPALDPLGAAIRAALPDKQLLAVYRLRAPKLSLPGLALAGEAAHAVHPMAAQGMNSSLSDAVTLAAQLTAAGGTEPAAIDQALAGYQKSRRPRLDHIDTLSHNAARMLTLTRGPGRRLGRRLMRHTAANPRLVALTTGNLSGVAVRPLHLIDRLYQFGLLTDRRAGTASTAAENGSTP